MKEEQFDIYDDNMNPIGQATRSETHKRGYWHKSFHCWLTRREGERQYVRFQLRQMSKDTNPGCYDITAAGHLSAGETVKDGARELEEELGITTSFETLVPLFEWREDASGTAKGVPFIDRELSYVFGLVCDTPISEMKLQADEVAGLYEADLSSMLELFEGRITAVEAHGIRQGLNDLSYSTETAIVQADHFVPRDRAYYIRVLQLLRSLT
ncbi:NUDIX hydrolase [Paenibacillus xylaniclasticus]|uniref:NUDIX hydrolase n=1 Tax=Paenibacillus xylaniclasticus TaxID=588083 RepID=UPI000FD98A9E|nr:MULTISPECIES: NUDIX domain-containing protein [Paenibacillus]GFN31559.1 putative Nudix hydrolase [Paenibacillus curdlanolyticus]